jgi:hypothetical protein
VLEPKKYQVAFDASFTVSDAMAAQTASAATNVLISPYPFALSVIAVLSAFLGVLLRVSLAGSRYPLQDLLSLAQSGGLFVGPVVALIFFNIYEYTSLGKGLTISISWRSALLIGALSGLAQERILASLKALIGI